MLLDDGIEFSRRELDGDDADRAGDVLDRVGDERGYLVAQWRVGRKIRERELLLTGHRALENAP